MKKILIISLSVAVLSVSARANVIIGSVTGRQWNVTSGTAGATSIVVTAQAGDVIVMGYAGNKTGTAITPTLTVTAGGANLLSPVTTSVASSVYPLSFARYYTVTAAGSFTFEYSTAGNTAGQTSGIGGYVLRAGTSGYVLTNVASAVFQDTLTTFDNGGNNSLSYSWANNISGGVVVEYIASRLATNTAPTGYSVNYSSTATNRMMVSYANVTGTSLTSTYTHLAPGANDTAGYVGLVFTEVAPDVVVVYYGLTVNSGSGSGSYTNGAQVAISASVINGKTFVQWTGDTQYLAGAATVAGNTVIMSTNAVTLTATYKDSQVVVSQKAGASENNTPGLVTVGTFTAQTDDILVFAAGGSNPTHINIDAVAWVSTNGGVVDANTLFSKASMGIWYTKVTAGGTFNVNFTKVSNYTTVGAYLVHATAGKTLQIATNTTSLVSGPESTNAAMTYSFAAASEGVVIECMSAFADGGAAPNTVTVDYTSSAPAKRIVGSGTFSDLLTLNTSWTVVQTPTNGSVGLGGIVIYANDVAPATSNALTVYYGTGSGSYTNGAVVEIAADAPAPGMTFDVWTGDTQGVASVTSSNTTVTMSTNAVTLTATYKYLVYTLTGSADANGNVTPSITNVVYGSNADFTVTAANYYRIASLTTNGTAVTGMPFDNNSTTTNFTWSNVQADGTLAATFTAQLAADPASTPYWWLAQYGLTNYNTDAAADQDLDGLKTWQEYIAGTDPTNKTSCLRAVESPLNVVSWSAVGGKVYSVYWSTNLVSGFTNLATGVQPPYTNAAPSTRANFYQVRVQLP